MKTTFVILLQTLCIYLFGACSGKDNTTAIERVNVSTFSQWIDTGKINVIDVRTPQEFAQGHLPGALNYNVNDADFATKLQSLPKDVPLAIYCQSGGRSAKAVKIASDLGYGGKELAGGITAWTGAKVTNDKIVKGKLIWGSEVFAFIPDGVDKTYWIYDKTLRLPELYRSVLPANAAPYTPVDATLVVIEKPKVTEGFPADYDGVYEVWRVISVN
ncbi:MAG: rhodanese-like domain-containing protein [Marinifilaceae bacterium]